MICNKCRQEKTEEEMVKTLGRNGIQYTGHSCKVCVSKQASINVKRRRKIKGTNEWLYKRLYRLKQNAAKRNYDYNLTDEFVKSLYLTKKCFYCGEETNCPTIDRKNNNIGYITDNCVMSCMKCNMLKGKIVSEDIPRIIKIINKI